MMIQELQLIEQNLSNLGMQKQNFQSRLLENDNAIKEISQNQKPPYKIIGNIMLEVNKDELKKELSSEKEIFELRIKNIEKQENRLKEKAQELQKEILKELK